MNNEDENIQSENSSDSSSDVDDESTSSTSSTDSNDQRETGEQNNSEKSSSDENFSSSLANRNSHSTANEGREHSYIRPLQQRTMSSNAFNDSQWMLKASAMKIPSMAKKTDPKEQQREWKKYKDTIKQFFSIANGFDTAKSKLAYMKLFCGEEIRDALIRTKIKKSNKTEKQKFKDIIKVLDNHFDSGINAQGFLKDFLKTKQNESESFVKFVQRLKIAAIDAEISQKNFENAIIIQAIAGTRIEKLKSADVYMKKTLKELEQLATTFEMDEKESKEGNSGKDDQLKQEALAVTNNRDNKNFTMNYRGYQPRFRGGHQGYGRPYMRPQRNDEYQYGRGMRGRYRYRGRFSNYANQGPNRNDQRCYNCNKWGHIAKMCSSRINNVEEKEIHKVTLNEEEWN